MSQGRFQTIPATTTLADLQKHNDNLTLMDTELTRIETDRKNEDSTLQTEITTETQNRIAADSAHANSTTAHAAEHITYSGLETGSNVKQAIDNQKTRIDNIVSYSGSSNQELVDTHIGVDGATYTVLNDRLNVMEAKQLAAAIQTAALTNGWNYVLSDTDSPLNVVIKGTTRVNLLGKDGNCESLTGWAVSASTIALDSTNKVYGSNGFKVTADIAAVVNIHKSVSVQSGKYYLVAAFCKNGTASKVLARIANSLGNEITSTSAFELSYAKYASASDAIVDVEINITATASGQYAYIDGIRLYEISAADYAAIDSMTTDEIAAKWGYCDSCQHLKNPILTCAGKNQLGPSPDTIHANAVLTAPYALTLNATAAFQGSSFTLDVLPNKTYTLSFGSISGVFAINQYDSSDNLVTGTDWLNTTHSFTTASNTTKVTVFFSNLSAGTFTFVDWQLELGSTATDFTPKNDSYLYVLTTLAGDPITGVYDTFDSETKTVTRRHKSGVLSGLTWAFDADYTGYKGVTISNYPSNRVTDYGYIVKYDGKLLVLITSIPGTYTGSDQFIIHSNGNFYMSIDDDDSGWGEDYTPSADEIKAMIEYGYKLNNGTFGTPYNGTGTKTWTRWDATDNTGAVTTVPTALASGYPGYELSYQLATTTTEAVQVEGSLSLVEGGNQLELSQGVIDREVVVPILVSGDGGYYINNNGDSSALDNRVDDFIAVYKNGLPMNISSASSGENQWYKNPSFGYGNYRLYIASQYFDATAEYTVTYTVLDKYSMTASATDADVTYSTSDHSVLGQVVQKQSDIETDVTISKNAIIDIYARLVAGGL